MTGRTISHFKVLDNLGGGGMGVVYLAEDLTLNRKVALKFLPPHLAADEEANQRFVQEAHAASALNHPNVCTIHEVGHTDEGQTFIAMAHYEGETLKQKLEDGALSTEEAVDIARQVADGLSAAHEKGIIHRDIKPANIFITRKGRAVILDFGLVKLAGGEELTKTGSTLGTARYMSPEQIRSEEVDSGTDVWSLGVVLYEMLTGMKPFSADYDAAALYAILNEQPQSPRASNDQVRDPISDLVMRMLHKIPDHRPSAASVSDSLRIGDVPIGRTDVTGRLPEAPTRFIGREKEIRECVAILATVRALTLTGPGGTGKTRLAREVAVRYGKDMRNGVVYVPLSSVRDASLVVPQIARIFAIRESASEPVLESLTKEIATAEILLLLDNFEQVLDAADKLAKILEACPNIKLMVTSRAPLRIRAESEYAVPPLMVPKSKTASASDLSSVESAQLFVDRVRALKPEFEVDEDNAESIAAICVALDGLPVALELAAARSRLLSPQDIAKRLASKLEILKGGSRDMPERHRTIRATVDWSYELLDSEEQNLLRRLSVFVGPFTLKAAEFVSVEWQDAGRDTIDVLQTLVEHSLVRIADHFDETRFSFLQIIREFGLERLDECSESNAARSIHSRFYTEYAREASKHLTGRGQRQWLDRLETLHADLRAALAWLLQRKDGATMLSLTSSLWRFWASHTHLREATEWLQLALSLPCPDTALRIEALVGFVQLCQWQHRIREFEQFVEELHLLGREQGDRRAISVALNIAGSRLTVRDSEKSRHMLEESLEHAIASGDDWACARAYHGLAELLRYLNELEGAERYYDNALHYYENLGSDESMQIGSILFCLGLLAFTRDEIDKARLHFIRGASMTRKLGDRRGMAYMVIGMGGVYAAVGDPKLGAVLQAAGHAALERLGTPIDSPDLKPIKRMKEILSRRLTSEALEAEWQRGIQAALDDALSMALSPSGA